MSPGTLPRREFHLNPRRLVTVGLLLATLSAAVLAPMGASGTATPLVIEEFTAPEETWCEIRDQWMADIYANHPEGTWAPLRWEPTDEQLKKLGFPGKEFLLTHSFPEPTLVFADGTTEVIELPDLPTGDGSEAPGQGLVAYAGAGCFGIRPGALLLTVTNSVIGWCSLGHVYGTPGTYKVSTAGHCGNVNDKGTVIAGIGNRNGVPGIVLLDFGRYSSSTGDGGIGNDWALITVDSQWQRLVSPTMCFWGGPIGSYTKTGGVVQVGWGSGGINSVSFNPDPTLASTVLHYGHGTGVGGPGVGTPRVGQVVEWRPKVMAWVGAITPGDSGSASNVLVGDALGTQREAAGINTHIYVGTDYYRDYGIGILASTRVTEVGATLANGQLVPYPAPLSGAP